ncbi:hypothetical protein TRFO_29876 [Tritrichomonas foetus]|uniref:Uncharacterized protein n=1 Tax=Tritrichomonas foetus TaxID=1144522 RepID=A0A1J4JW39_9EUKA|nr:hypothetical protein TRFO_29876 [Tritrichomonas foetus]|eukprot:OHT02930.1 hypothetical protein TRFO_29876 [Tritrichomonas foetus]
MCAEVAVSTIPHIQYFNKAQLSPSSIEKATSMTCADQKENIKKSNPSFTPGVEYDTVRGRGDFDEGYLNEYMNPPYAEGNIKNSSSFSRLSGERKSADWAKRNGRRFKHRKTSSVTNIQMMNSTEKSDTELSETHVKTSTSQPNMARIDRKETEKLKNSKACKPHKFKNFNGSDQNNKLFQRNQ